MFDVIYMGVKHKVYAINPDSGTFLIFYHFTKTWNWIYMNDCKPYKED